MERVRTAADADRFAVINHYGDPSVPKVGDAMFRVAGAGWIAFGRGICFTGDATGLAFEVSWSRYGYSSGVLGRAEAAALRDFLTTYLDGTLEVVEQPTGEVA